MPRTARIKSPTGIYHIMLRGVNRRQLFFDEEDNERFLYILNSYISAYGHELYAYCLMGNHVHLLLKEGTEDIGMLFKRMGASFAWWYNNKYDRAGHIFQDRFRSEPVDTEQYLFTVLRYILRNPVAAGLCTYPEDYPYSSASEYMCCGSGITDTSFIFDIIDRESLVQYIRQENNDECLEMETSGRRGVTDAVAVEMIKKEFGTLTPEPGRKRDRTAFSNSVAKLYKEGVSVRQLSRLTGISKGILQRCGEKEKM